jgi:CDP-diacylglycerol--serine O-phosphatidyltransferase
MAVQWRYVVPSLVTCTSITVGMLSITEAVAGRYRSSAWFILLCVLLDKADGTTARALKATSKFGLELDSLSDFMAFGVAPAVLALTMLAGPKATGPAWMPGEVYRYTVYVTSGLWLITSALRLAKFNVKSEDYGETHFFGIPTTFSAALVAAYYLTVIKYNLPQITVHVLPGLMILFSLLMVSRIPLRKIGKRKSLVMNILLVTNTVVVYAFGILRLFPEYLLACGVVYLVIGAPWAIAAGVRPPGQAAAEPDSEA